MTLAGRDGARSITIERKYERILSAHSVDASGRKRDGLITQRKLSDGSVAGNVAFPKLEIGDTYEFETGYDVDVRMLQRGLMLFYDKSASLGRFTVEVDAPTGFVEVESADFGEAVHRHSKNRESWSWEATSLPELTLDSAIDAMDVRPRVAVSFDRNFKANMNEVARHYEKAELESARMREVAASLVKPGASTREKAAAALTWIQQNIQYTDAPEFVDETLLPTPVDVTIERRKGMCRDLVAAYGSLLRALDVRAEPVSLNTSSFWQPRIPVTQKQNHIITYLPELDAFVDPSDTGWPVGMWSFQLDHRRGFNLSRLEWMDIRFDPAWNGESDEAHIYIDANGKGRATTTLRFLGQLADSERMSIAQEVAANTPHRHAPKLLKWVGVEGEGTVHPVDSPDRKQFGYDIVYTFDGTEHLSPASPVGLPRIPSWKDFRFSDLASDRHSHHLCIPERHEQRLSIHWPPELVIARAPRDMRLSNSAGEYRSTYVADGALLTVTRSFTSQWTKPICTSADTEALKEIETFIAQDRAQKVSLAARTKP